MIYINARFLSQNLTGVQRYATELSFLLKKIYGDQICFLAPKNIIQEEVARRLDVEIIGSHSGYYWEQVELPYYLRKKGNPLLVSFCSVAPLFYSNNVFTLHDITWIKYPGTFSKSFIRIYNFLIPKLCRRAKHILTVSNFSKMEISNQFGVPKEKLSVIYNAVDNKFCNILDNDLLSESYFLAVSSVKENKNFPTVLSSFNKVLQKLPSVKLYVIGDMHDKVFSSIDLSEYDNNPNIKFLGRVSDEDLVRYYSNALAFIFPSLYEGFGIPALEAQSCGCPVISSKTSSLPEILQESAMFADPMDVDSFAKQMYLLTSDKKLRSELIERGYKNVQRFSWLDSAKKIATILNVIQE